VALDLDSKADGKNECCVGHLKEMIQCAGGGELALAWQMKMVGVVEDDVR